MNAPDKRYRNILLLVHQAARYAGAMEDHIRGYADASRHNVVIIDAAHIAQLVPDLSVFDAIVIHHSVVATLAAYLPESSIAALAAAARPKFLFIQDEYRTIDAMAAVMGRLRLTGVFTLLAPADVRDVYHHAALKGVDFHQVLTGYVPPDLIARAVPDYADRRLDVLYRARRLPPWYGQAAGEKWEIAERFGPDAARAGLKIDISTREGDRLYGARWHAAVASAKAVLGTESAVSVLDFTGGIEQVTIALATGPAAMSEADIYQQHVAPHERRPIRMISPRCFEAAALRTLMVLYPGAYSGVLQPDRHYVMLERDHTNMSEVVAILRDAARARAIIARAYTEIACNPAYGYGALAAIVDGAIEAAVEPRGGFADRDLARAYLAQSLDAHGIEAASWRLARGNIWRGRLARGLLRLETTALRAVPRGVRTLAGPRTALLVGRAKAKVKTWLLR